jgi:hypothetical protein
VEEVATRKEMFLSINSPNHGNERGRKIQHAVEEDKVRVTIQTT